MHLLRPILIPEQVQRARERGERERGRGGEGGERGEREGERKREG